MATEQVAEQFNQNDVMTAYIVSYYSGWGTLYSAGMGQAILPALYRAPTLQLYGFVTE